MQPHEISAHFFLCVLFFNAFITSLKYMPMSILNQQTDKYQTKGDTKTNTYFFHITEKTRAEFPFKVSKKCSHEITVIRILISFSLPEAFQIARHSTAQKMKFSIKELFSKCDQIRRKL